MLGNQRPRVAVLSATEELNERMPSTCAAAAVVKRVREMDIGCEIEGPLALDNAVSASAAAVKGSGNVAGRADILIVHNIETGNALAKGLIHYAGATAAGLVLGANVPIILPSRSDPVAARLAAAAIVARLVLSAAGR